MTKSTLNPVLTGKRFQLLFETLVIETSEGDNRIAVKVPAGETITILNGPRPNDKRLVDVSWAHGTWLCSSRISKSVEIK